jgi:3-methyladenine DNA glycosylase AlkD
MSRNADSGFRHAKMNDILTHLKALVLPGDDEYREFNARIVATGYEVLGVRTPALRRLAKEIASGPGVREYLWEGPGGGKHGPGSTELTHEEVLLYGLVLAARSRRMPLEEVFTRLERLVPYFDSWAHVDVIVSDIKIFARHGDEVLRRFAPFKTHEGEFFRRTFVILVMDYLLDADHIDSSLEELAGVPQGQYYVDMAIAWALSVALVKHWHRTEPLFHAPVFSRFVHNKAIQKARESRRITPEQKEYLNTLKI